MPFFKAGNVGIFCFCKVLTATTPICIGSHFGLIYYRVTVL